MSKVTKPIATDETLQSVVSTLQTVAEKLSEIAADETLQGVAKDTTLAEVTGALEVIEGTLKNAGKDETLQQIAKDATLQNAVSALQSVVETLGRVSTDETLQELAKDATLQGVAKDITLKTLASDTSLQAVTKAIEDKDAILLRMAEALDAKDTTQDRLSEIVSTAEEKKQELEIVGEQVKATIPDDYSTLSEKVNNASNALKGTASGEGAVGISDVSSNEHTMDVKVRSRNLFNYRLIEEHTKDGLTVSTTEDDGVVISGTAETTYTYMIANNAELGTRALLSPGTYTISGNTSLIAVVVLLDGTALWKRNTFTLDEPAYLRDMIVDGLTVGTEYDMTIYPQVEEGTEATEYTPYVDVSAVSVKRYGKNLLNPIFDSYLWVGIESGSTITENTSGYSQIVEVKPNTTYTISGNFTGANANYVRIAFTEEYPTVGVVTVMDRVNNTEGNPIKTFTTSSNCHYLLICTGASQVYDYTSGNVMLEEGTTATEYEPYIEPTTYIPNTDGNLEGVTSIYPTTTLLTDTEGVIVDCEYNRDINKAYEELVNAIVSLGGNV